MPERAPGLACIIASPHSAARRPGPDSIRLRGMADDAGHTSTDVGRPDALPLRRDRRRRERRLDSHALVYQRANRRFADGPSGSTLEPDGTRLVSLESGRRTFRETLLPRSTRRIDADATSHDLGGGALGLYGCRARWTFSGLLHDRTPNPIRSSARGRTLVVEAASWPRARR